MCVCATCVACCWAPPAAARAAVSPRCVVAHLALRCVCRTCVVQFNIAFPAHGTMYMDDIEDESVLRAFYDKRISQEVDGDVMGEKYAGYRFRITGGNDKQGFPMIQGLLINKRAKLLLKTGAYPMPCPACRSVLLSVSRTHLLPLCLQAPRPTARAARASARRSRSAAASSAPTSVCSTSWWSRRAPERSRA